MADDDSAVLSDVDDEDPSPVPIATDQSQQLIRDLRSQLDAERSARQKSDETLRVKDDTITRLRAFAHDCIKKRDDALKEKDDTFAKLADSVKQNEQISKQLADAFREKEEISKQKVGLKSEMDMAAQLMATGIDKISGKVSSFNNFAAGGLPRSQKYATGLPSVAYGVIRRANEIVEELMKQVDGAAKSRDQAREQIEQRNYEIAIEVSQLEATISGLRDEVSKKGGEIERLERLVGERDAKISEMEREVSELRRFGEERDVKLRNLVEKMNSQRRVVIDQLSNVSKAHEQLNTIVRIADGCLVDQSSDLSFVWEEMDMDMDENLKSLLEGTVLVYETAKVAVGKVRGGMEEKSREIEKLMEKVDGLLAEKQHIGTLLRSALQSKTNEVLQVAEDGLREAGIDLRFNGHGKSGVQEGEVDEVYTLAGALENTVKASQLEIVELKHLVEALRDERSGFYF